MYAESRTGKNFVTDGVLLSMIAEVLLICATVLGFFVQFDFPMSLATGAALAVLFIGSMLCWKSQAASAIILALSLLAIEGMLSLRFPILLLPFALADVVILVIVAGTYHAGDQQR